MKLPKLSGACSLKSALITGVTGQDGSYLAEFLIRKRLLSFTVSNAVLLSFNTGRIDDLFHGQHAADGKFTLHHGDITTDASSLQIHIMEKVAPDEIYNLAAQSHVAVSFEEPEYTANSDALGTLRMLEAMRNPWAWKRNRNFIRRAHQNYMA